jgi:hypothetical protein
MWGRRKHTLEIFQSALASDGDGDCALACKIVDQLQKQLNLAKSLFLSFVDI